MNRARATYETEIATRSPRYAWLMVGIVEVSLAPGFSAVAQWWLISYNFPCEVNVCLSILFLR